MKRNIFIVVVSACFIALIVFLIQVGCANNGFENQKGLDEDKNASEEIIKSIELRPEKKKSSGSSSARLRKNYGRVIDITSKFLTIKNRSRDQKFYFSDQTKVFDKQKIVVELSSLELCQTVRVVKLNKNIAGKIYILKETDCLKD
jgi:hypothetical protein